MRESTMLRRNHLAICLISPCPARGRDHPRGHAEVPNYAMRCYIKRADGINSRIHCCSSKFLVSQGGRTGTWRPRQPCPILPRTATRGPPALPAAPSAPPARGWSWAAPGGTRHRRSVGLGAYHDARRAKCFHILPVRIQTPLYPCRNVVKISKSEISMLGAPSRLKGLVVSQRVKSCTLTQAK